MKKSMLGNLTLVFRRISFSESSSSNWSELHQLYTWYYWKIAREASWCTAYHTPEIPTFVLLTWYAPLLLVSSLKNAYNSKSTDILMCIWISCLYLNANQRERKTLNRISIVMRVGLHRQWVGWNGGLSGHIDKERGKPEDQYALL